MLQKFAIVKCGVFYCENLQRVLRASTEGYLAVAASTPTSATLSSAEL